jgi:pyruvyl transferase EpsI
METTNALNQPEISVIIPVYHVEQFIHACIDSVLAQTFRGYEIILVDDGATDRCPAICDAYAKAHEQIRVIHQKNGGLSAARNTGFAAAKGTYVYFLDSDDLIVPRALQTLYDIAQSKETDAVFFEACVIDESGRPIYHPGYTNFYNRTIVYEGCRPGKQLFCDMLQNGDYLPAVPLSFLRRAAVKQAFSPILHEDELFTPKLLYSIERACTCADALYVRRVRAASITTEQKNHRHFCGMATAARELMEFPLADGTLKNHATKLARSAVDIYSQISPAERKRSKAEKHRLFRALVAQRGLGAWATAAFLQLPFLHALFRALKQRVPNWAFRINATLRDRKRFTPVLRQIAATSPEHRRIFLIGSPEHGNLGDHAIAMAEREFFRDHAPNATVFDISMPFYRACRRSIGKLARKTDLIAVSGGGWLGNVWYHNEKTVFDILRRFRDNRIVIFPQTIYYQPSRKTARQKARAKRAYGAHKNLTLLLREQESLALAKTLCADARYCPDMCLYLDERAPRTREGILLCFRQDREKTLSSESIRGIEARLLEKGEFFRHTTTVLEKNISTAHSDEALGKKLEEFRKARLVITDRLHAALFGVVTGTPCIAFDNLTKKVSGVLAGCGEQNGVFFAANQARALDKIDELLQLPSNDLLVSPSFEVLIDIWRNELG